jgi:hypothetical protein
MSTEAEFNTALARDMVRFYDDPLGFVRYCFDWGHGELIEWDGPDEWQTEFLTKLGDAVKAALQAIRSTWQ